MTVPMAYSEASKVFEQFLSDAREASGLTTRHQTYTMVEGVFRTFRQRLEVRDAIHFASVLPPLLRALFVDAWDLDAPIRPFEDRASMTREVQSLRRDHNFAPDTAIHDVAVALRKSIDEAALDRMLARLPAGAAEFWQI